MENKHTQYLQSFRMPTQLEDTEHTNQSGGKADSGCFNN